jgi:hypothetical protein
MDLAFSIVTMMYLFLDLFMFSYLQLIEILSYVIYYDY